MRSISGKITIWILCRTGSKYSPYPEEMNRSLTGRIASYHFAPIAVKIVGNISILENALFVI